MLSNPLCDSCAASPSPVGHVLKQPAKRIGPQERIRCRARNARRAEEARLKVRHPAVPFDAVEDQHLAGLRSDQARDVVVGEERTVLWESLVIRPQYNRTTDIYPA
eukprot:scaffold3026_cov221-Pinguiococcus_pyrenoidosus.AAC.14